MRRLLGFIALLIVPISLYAQTVPLDDGYLGTRGSQIVNSGGRPVRIAAIGWAGADGRANVPRGLDSVSLHDTVRQMATAGFNTVRIPFSDRIFSAYPSDDAIDRLRNPDLIGLKALEVLDKVVGAAGSARLRVILDHNNNQGDSAPLRLGGQQPNGLWFDRGPRSTGEDGSGNAGRVTAETLQTPHWVALARRYANNPTVIGFGLHNEPNAGSMGNGINWGEGGPTDLRIICTEVGTAIQAVNPDALIICEGIQDQASGYPEGDLRGVAARPVVLPVPNKVVYSVREFPTDVSGIAPVGEPATIERMNRAWGYLITNDIAPVFVGEMGSSMLTAGSRAWAKTMVAYLNGTAPDGIRLARSQVSVSAGWWAWGDLTGEVPLGVLRGGWEPWMNRFRPEQQAVWSQLSFRGQAIPIESATR